MHSNTHTHTARLAAVALTVTAASHGVNYPTGVVDVFTHIYARHHHINMPERHVQENVSQ